MMEPLTLGLAGVSVLGSIFGIGSTNAAAKRAQEDERRRYELQANIAKQQMGDLQTDAMVKMTDTSRKFLQAKGKLITAQAESGVAGNVQQRMALSQRFATSEAKGKIAREINTSTVNIANQMLARKIDTEANIAKAEASKVTGLSAVAKVASAGISGAMAGDTLASTDFMKNLSLDGIFGSKEMLPFDPLSNPL